MEGFDLKTHVRDPKTGKIVKTQPYKLVCTKEKGWIFIRDGVEYFQNGELVNPSVQKVESSKVESFKK